MEHGTSHARAVHIAMGLWDVRTSNSSLNFFQAVFTLMSSDCDGSPGAIMSPR